MYNYKTLLRSKFLSRISTRKVNKGFRNKAHRSIINTKEV